MKKLFLLLLVFMSLFSACKKGTDQTPNHSLPPPTQDGSNTFGCLVNGTVFLPAVASNPNPAALTLAPLFAYYSVDSAGRYLLTMQASNAVNKPFVLFNFSYTGTALQSGDTIQLADEVNDLALPLDQRVAYCHYVTETDNGPQVAPTIDTFTMKPPLGGTMTILKLDTGQKIVSGTFSFDAMDPRGNKIQVTQGRFDLTYRNSSGVTY